MIRKFFIPVALCTLILFMTSCGGSGGGSSSTSRGVNAGIPSVVKLTDVQNIVQTNSSAFFKARILDGNGSPVPNERVTFTNLSSIGTLNAVNAVTVANTDDLGFATATVFSAEEGFVTVQAEVNSGAGQVRDRRTVFFTSGSLALFPFMLLDVDGDGDGNFNEPDDFILLQSPTDVEVLVRATVFSNVGLPVAFSEVLFGADVPYRVGTDTSCTDGTDSCEVVFPDGVQKFANSAGQAFVRVRFEANSIRSVQTLFNVLAQADNGAFNLVTLFVEPIFISQVILSADPSIVDTEGTSTITADAITNLNTPPPDETTVNFRTTCGSVEPFAQTTDGRAESEFTAPSTQGTCTVTGSVAGVSGSVGVLVTSALSVLPPSQSVNAGIQSTVTFTISGGVPSYSVFSSDPTLPSVPTTVSSSGGTFSVTVSAGTLPKTVTYTVRDAAGEEVTATLVIGITPLIVTPSQTQILACGGSSILYTVTGGIPPYTATSSNPLITITGSPVNTDGGQFTATSAACTPAPGPGVGDIDVDVTVEDSNSPQTTVTVTITFNDP